MRYRGTSAGVPEAAARVRQAACSAGRSKDKGILALTRVLGRSFSGKLNNGCCFMHAQVLPKMPYIWCCVWERRRCCARWGRRPSYAPLIAARPSDVLHLLQHNKSFYAHEAPIGFSRLARPLAPRPGSPTPLLRASGSHTIPFGRPAGGPRLNALSSLGTASLGTASRRAIGAALAKPPSSSHACHNPQPRRLQAVCTLGGTSSGSGAAGFQPARG